MGLNKSRPIYEKIRISIHKGRAHLIVTPICAALPEDVIEIDICAREDIESWVVARTVAPGIAAEPTGRPGFSLRLPICCRIYRFTWPASRSACACTRSGTEAFLVGPSQTLRAPFGLG